MPKPKRIFIAATMQNDGKTTFSLGFIAALKKRFKNIGFIKPIGQRYLMEQGFKVDEDSVLIEKVFGLGCGLVIKDLSPVAVERGFTERYIDGKKDSDYAQEIVKSFDRVAKASDLVIIEGTGHAGVGSVFDLSNAVVAKLLDSKVILVTPGGIGRPIDEAMLNKALFDAEGVEIMGVIVNKVMPQKFDKVNHYVRLGFEKKKVNVLGVMPHQRRLDMPTMREINDELCEDLGIKVLCGAKYLDNAAYKILVGAMEVKAAMKYIEDNTLLITPQDRLDIIKAAIDVQSGTAKKKARISGLILSGGGEPPGEITELLEKYSIPTFVSDKDTYSVAAAIHGIQVKIKPEDKVKVGLITDMVSKYCDIDRIIESI